MLLEELQIGLAEQLVPVLERHLQELDGQILPRGLAGDPAAPAIEFYETLVFGPARPGPRGKGEGGGRHAARAPAIAPLQEFAKEMPVGLLSLRRDVPPGFQPAVIIGAMPGAGQRHPIRADHHALAEDRYGEIDRVEAQFVAGKDVQRQRVGEIRVLQHPVKPGHMIGKPDVAIAQMADDLPAGLQDGLVPIGLAAALMLGMVEEGDARIAGDEIADGRGLLASGTPSPMITTSTGTL